MYASELLKLKLSKIHSAVEWNSQIFHTLLMNV